MIRDYKNENPESLDIVGRALHKLAQPLMCIGGNAALIKMSCTTGDIDLNDIYHKAEKIEEKIEDIKNFMDEFRANMRRMNHETNIHKQS